MRWRPVLLGLTVWLLPALAAEAAVKGLAIPYPASHVSSVEVVQSDRNAPAAFADAVRADLLQEAALYGANGQSLILKVEIKKVHVKNALKAMVLGDANYAWGEVTVVDASNGRPLGDFKVAVSADRPGVGMTLLGMVDPTGLVNLSNAVSGTNRPREELIMESNFARETLRRTYGDARMKAAHLAKPAPPAAPATPPSATATEAQAAPPANELAEAANEAVPVTNETLPVANAVVPPLASNAAAP
ncbi:MAG: hypothetical protein JO127_09745 [Caulobacteraceae bacterium]|nr:hypothetical protein [Caulobacteraceae bacterium]